MLSNNRGLFTRLFLLWLFVLGAVSGIWQDDDVAVLPVTASTLAVSTQQSTTEPLAYRFTRVGHLSNITKVLLNEAKNRFYAVAYSWENQRLEFQEYDAFSLDVLRTLPLSEYVAEVLWIGNTADWQTIYYISNDQSVSKVNLATWTQQTVFNLPVNSFPPYIQKYEYALGTNNLLYTIGDNENIVGYDVETGSIAQTLNFTETVRSFEIWQDDLYVLSENQNFENTLHKYHLVNGEAQLIQSRFLFESNLYIARTIGDGSHLVLASPFDGRIQIIDTTTLENGSLGANWPNSAWLSGISPDGQYVFTFESTFGNGNLSFIKQYSLNTGELIASTTWHTNYYDQNNSIRDILPNNDVVLADGYVYRRFDHNIVIPMIGYKSCPINPFVDTFDNPNSGWPIRATEEMMLGYVDGRYHIAHVPPSQWLAITQRHDSDAETFFSVDVEIVGNSVSGIVFGLKPNWTEFFTFEYYPQYQIAALFRYTNEAGWELLIYRTIYIAHTMNLSVRLQPQSAEVKINNGSGIGYSFLAPTFDFRGSVGLIGGTTNGSAITWFDNYYLDRKSCGFIGWDMSDGNNRMAADGLTIEVAPANVAERPPFETFLTAEQRATLSATPEP